MNGYCAPGWMKPYATGQKVGFSQAMMAYSSYYGTDGSADLDPNIEERLPMLPTPMVSYASRTGTRRNLDAMRSAGWRLLVSAKGVLRTEGFRYALDNGAWTAFQQGEKFDELAFGRAVELLGENADFIVIPDIVMGGMESLEFSMRWLDRLKGIPTKLLFAVQNGMSPSDLSIREVLSPSVGIFVGGDTSWKLATVNAWGEVSRRRNCYLHVGRVNSAKRIKLCAAAGTNSIDGTSVTRFAKTLPPLEAALRQAANQKDMFDPSVLSLQDVPHRCWE